LDPALEAVTHDEIGPAPKLAQKPLEPGEIVAIVGVAHDDITPSGGRDASAQRRTVAAFGNRHDARPLASAIACDPSLLPLSATSTSPSTAARLRKSCALSMQRPAVSASFRHGIKIVSSIDFSASVSL